MANMNIKGDVLQEVRDFKVHPKETDSETVHRIIGHYKELCPDAVKELKIRFINTGN